MPNIGQMVEMDPDQINAAQAATTKALVTMALAIRGTDFAPGTAEADISFARDLGVIASFHVACAKHGPRPQSMQSLAQQGLLGKDINLVHANFLNADEFRLVAESLGNVGGFEAVCVGALVVILYDAGEGGGQVQHAVHLVREGFVADVRFEFVGPARG